MTDDTLTLGDLIKSMEEPETSRRLPEGSFIYARLDGRSFSSFTRGMDKPYDVNMQSCMMETTKRLMRHTQALLGYTQSDEISLVWDPKKRFFDGKITKIHSVLAGMASSTFALDAVSHWPDLVRAFPPAFDCRVMALPSEAWAVKVLLWRERDARKNAVHTAAMQFFSHADLYKKRTHEKKALCEERGYSFSDKPDHFVKGALFRRETELRLLTDEELERIPEERRPTEPVLRGVIRELNIPILDDIRNQADVLFRGAEPIPRRP
jgi:tRNA(His) guanylyltransferase